MRFGSPQATWETFVCFTLNDSFLQIPLPGSFRYSILEVSPWSVLFQLRFLISSFIAFLSILMTEAFRQSLHVFPCVFPDELVKEAAPPAAPRTSAPEPEPRAASPAPPASKPSKPRQQTVKPTPNAAAAAVMVRASTSSSGSRVVNLREESGMFGRRVFTDESSTGRRVTEEVSASRRVTEEVSASRRVTDEVPTGRRVTEDASVGRRVTEEVSAGRRRSRSRSPTRRRDVKVADAEVSFL